jgi:type II secretory pathway component PulF
MIFKYTGMTKNGKKVSSSVEADSLVAAKSKIKANNILYMEIKEDKNIFFLNNLLKRKEKAKISMLSNFSRDLSIYLNSGISLVNSISLLKQSYKKDKKFETFINSLETFLKEGQTFSSALENQTIYAIPEFYKQSIKISEEGGLLQTVLVELATFLKEQERVKKQVSQALVYPLFILFVSFFMVAFMLSFIVPKITSIFEQIDQELPTSTKIVIALGDFFENHIEMIIIVLVLVIFSFLFAYKKIIKFKFLMDSFVLKLPFFSRLIELNELSRFSYMNSILIRSGVPVVQSFNLSSNILNNSVIKKVFVEASSKVVEGENLSKILANNTIYKLDTAFTQAISIGEETSTLSQILHNLSELYNESNKDKINIFLSLLEPIFMLIVGSTIGFIVLAMLLPIFSMNLG